MSFNYAITLQGNTPSDKTTLRFDLGEPADYAAAISAANQIRGALVDVTDAFVSREVLSELISEDGQRPAAGVNTFVEAAVSVFLNEPTDAVKLATLRIPAPAAALFLADGETVNIGNALLVQLVQQISQHAFISDGEAVVTDVQDGISGGYKRTRAKKFA